MALIVNCETNLLTSLGINSMAHVISRVKLARTVELIERLSESVAYEVVPVTRMMAPDNQSGRDSTDQQNDAVWQSGTV